MGRLTNSDKEIPTLDNNAEYWLQVYFKLKDFEDIIDDPEKLKLIDALYLERCEEINGLKTKLEEYKKIGTSEEITEILSIVSEGQDDVDESGISTGMLKALGELAEYKRLEEEGALLRLPCKEVLECTGDTLYCISEDEVIEVVHCGISIDYDRKIWIALVCDENIFPYREPDAEHDTDPTDWCTNSMQTTLDEWNKTIFLTREEAEQALERMKEVQDK